MALMTWIDGLSVGNAHMDNQRKNIIQLMDMLIKNQCEQASGLNAEFCILLRKLRISLARHFIEEEYLLEQNGCPSFEEHAVDHAYIILKLSETDKMESKELLNERIPLLKKLLESHIAVHDLECRGYFSE